MIWCNNNERNNRNKGSGANGMIKNNKDEMMVTEWHDDGVRLERRLTDLLL